MPNKNIPDFAAASALTGAELIELTQGGVNKRAAINGVFQDFFNGSFWPLSGSAALTNDLDIDGAFDLIFGSITPLTNVAFYIDGEFNVDADQVVLRAQDGTDLTELVFDESFFALTTQGVSYVSIDSEVSVGLSADDGVDSSSLTLTPNSVTFAGAPIGLPTYTVATLPASPDPGLFAFCSDESGGEVPVFSDNSGNWRRVTDGNIAST